MAAKLKVDELESVDGSTNLILNNSVTMASGKTLPAASLTGTVPTASLGSGTASNSVFLRGDGSWQTAGSTSASDLTSGTLPIARIADDAIVEAKIGPGAVVTAAINDDAVTTAKINANAVGLTELAGIARGKLIYGDSGGDPAVLSPGSANQVLTSDGTDISWAAAAGGKVLQVVYSTATTSTYPTTSWTSIATGTISITPSSTSSKILYVYNTGGLLSGTANAMGIRMKRAGTVIRTIDRWGYNTNSSWIPGWFTFTYIDTPSTTSSVQYTLEGIEGNSAGWEINDSVGSGPGAMVMAMEIGV